MNTPQFKNKINQLASKRIPFIFIIDYSTKHAIIEPINTLNPDEILYSINGTTNFKHPKELENNKLVSFEKYPISIESYAKSFQLVRENLEQGNSYLTNLTCETPIKTNLSLKEIFYKSCAPYKLWYKNAYVVFSPEIFVKIEAGRIKSFPMKGTIDANKKNAKKIILTDAKEKAEHATIVDLIRNDLSKISVNVKVDKYKFIDRIKTNQGALLQMSSQISGELPTNYRQNLGDMLFDLLPAGSITGAPKKKTLEIIKKAENYKRGFYTGIFGIFDGTNLDSAVMIRFIENNNGNFTFKSGGGITVNSTMEDEYNEMIQKVYLPF